MCSEEIYRRRKFFDACLPRSLFRRCNFVKMTFVCVYFSPLLQEKLLCIGVRHSQDRPSSRGTPLLSNSGHIFVAPSVRVQRQWQLNSSEIARTVHSVRLHRMNLPPLVHGRFSLLGFVDWTTIERRVLFQQHYQWFI